MTVKSRRTAVGAAAAAFALVGVTACGGAPQVPNLPQNLPNVPGIGDPKAAFGNAHQSALGLAALGGLGVAQLARRVGEHGPRVRGRGGGDGHGRRGGLGLVPGAVVVARAEHGGRVAVGIAALAPARRDRSGDLWACR